MVEQRRKKRLHVYSYICINKPDDDKTVGQIKDITTEGMRLYGDQPLKPFSRYRFKMVLPNQNRRKQEIEFDADVVWSKKDSLFDMYDSGIRLKNITDRDRLVIEEFMQSTDFEERWLDGHRILKQEY